MAADSPTSPRARLIGTSFLMLFVELALIRWIGSNVVFLSYFSNFVLLGSFLGIGIGFLKVRSRWDFFAWAAVLLAFLVGFVLIFPVQIACVGSQLILFGCTPSGLPIWVTLPVVFVAVASIMAAIAQGVARTFVRFSSLEAYRLDILGSLAGILTFSVLAFLGAPPVVWGGVVSLTFFILYPRPYRLIQLVAIAGTIVMLGKESLSAQDRWSPYYKISVVRLNSQESTLNVNGIPHQMIESVAERRKTEPIYFAPYARLRGNPLRSVLIVGAGNGSDVAIALAAGAKHIDAVEIDPRIYQIGQELNPNQPYRSPAVTVHIDDGRAFLERTKNRYDLILFALPDSLTLVSGQSSLRLESYLFTIESMRAARAHLSADGAFGMYNYYRETWLLDRLARTLEVAYGQRPCVDTTSGSVGQFSLLIIGREPGAVSCRERWNPAERDIPNPVDDNHPFLYLRSPSIPNLYLVAIAAIFLVSLLAVRFAAGSFSRMKSDLDLFFMGAAFLLLETKSVVQFALLFGTTWFVNALVFFSVLVTVFVAVEVARRVRFGSPSLLYGALLVALALAWAVQPASLLPLDFPLRLAAAASLAFAPIFIANLIFAERFRESGSATVAFGANLFGAMVGGVLEYSSLLVGYRSLLIVVGVLYAFAFVAGRRSQVAPMGIVLLSEP